MRNITPIVIVFITLFISSCRKAPEESIAAQDIVFKKEATLHLIKNVTGDTIQTIDIEIADTDYDIQTGLMYRESMKPNHGMLFIFEEDRELSFYMKNTLFPLDIIYINNDQRIVDFKENTQPRDETPLPSAAPARYTLEINAGLAEQWGLDIGDRVVWE